MNFDGRICCAAAEVGGGEAAVDLSNKVSATSVVSPAYASERQFDAPRNVLPYDCMLTVSPRRGKSALYYLYKFIYFLFL